MSIVVGLPPIYDAILAHGITPPKTAVYTYGDTIYNPSGHELSDELVTHERTHTKQHAKIGASQWWVSWLADPKFRIAQELQAYQAQYRHYIMHHLDRNDRARYAFGLAQDLSGPMYGHAIPFGEAYMRITH